MKNQLRRVTRFFNRAIAGAIIRNNHTNPLIRTGACFCYWYLSCYWNEKYWNMKKNGELLLLSTLAKHCDNSRITTAFDVGANTGSYTKMIREMINNSIIHCFEVVPDTRECLVANLAGMKNILISDYGLSDTATYLQIVYNAQNDTEAREMSPILGNKDNIIACKVRTGDHYVAEHNIETIDILKIDTEGHEINVLKGFKNTLETSRIRVIQFEYGTTWIAPCHFLHEAYAILKPAGFYIGRLYPDGVLFKPYDRLQDDHFRMGNYVAVHRTYLALIRALSIKGSDP